VISPEAIYKKLDLRDITRNITASLLGDMYLACKQGKVTCEQISRLQQTFPILEKQLPECLLEYVESSRAGAVRRDILTKHDREYLQVIKIGDPKTIFKLCIESLDLAPKEFAAFLEQSKIGDVARAMGYESAKYPQLMKRLAQVKGLYQSYIMETNNE
jgi:hypothetical protein